MEKTKFLPKITLRTVLDVAFIAAVIAMGIFLNWKIMEIITFAFFIWIILHPIPSSYPAAAVIFFLVLTPIFLVSKKDVLADQFAIYAYYFLVMTVIMGIYEVRKEKSETKEE